MENLDIKEVAAHLRLAKTEIVLDGDSIKASIERTPAPVTIEGKLPSMEELDRTIARTQSDLDDLLLLKANYPK